MVVDIGQAGETVACGCGVTLDVPTLRQLRQLERAGSEPESPRRQWGPRQGVMVLGLSITVVGAAVAAYLWCQRPAAPEMDTEAALRQIDARMEGITPLQSWVLWHERILREGLIQYQTPALVAYRKQCDKGRHWTKLALAIATLGLLVFLAAVMLAPAQRGT